MHRRFLLKSLPALAGAAALPAVAAPPALLRRAIPSSGEKINAVGLGTWLTFDVAALMVGAGIGLVNLRR